MCPTFSCFLYFARSFCLKEPLKARLAQAESEAAAAREATSSAETRVRELEQEREAAVGAAREGAESLRAEQVGYGGWLLRDATRLEVSRTYVVGVVLDERTDLFAVDPL